MHALSIQWLRGARGASPDGLTPAQRAVRVLQVTRANWPLAEGRRGRRAHLSVAKQPQMRLVLPQIGA